MDGHWAKGGFYQVTIDLWIYGSALQNFKIMKILSVLLHNLSDCI